MYVYEEAIALLKDKPRHWLVSGVAGFIGSHLAESLLKLDQQVTGLDDFSAGNRKNLEILRSGRFTFIEGDIRDKDICSRACEGCDFVLHHAAIASVVKSVENPDLVHAVNVGGLQNILSSARQKGIARVVYASSSAIYGDGGDEPRNELHDLQPKSPYAETKIANEKDAGDSETGTIGLRYFNIYGARQDPEGAYAAVIPKWVESILLGREIKIFGDGKTIRDFCHVDDVVQANILAATTQDQQAVGEVCNVGSGQGTNLNELFSLIRDLAGAQCEPVYEDFRVADIRISQADISKAKELLGFSPSVSLRQGLERVINDRK